MPIDFVPQPNYRAQATNRAWWMAHYMAKGCSERKARECAFRKRNKPPLTNKSQSVGGNNDRS